MPRKRLSILFVAFLCTLVITVVGALLFSLISVQQLRARKISSAARWAAFARPVAHSVDAATLRRVADVHIWSITLDAVTRLPSFIDTFTHAQQSTDGAYFHTTPLLEPLAQTQTWLHELNALLPQSLIARRVVPDAATGHLRSLEALLTETVPVLRELSVGEHQALIFFQNHHELRATGGFMGSYALINFSDGRVTSITVEDIYDADGQFAGFVEAPPGVREYLSSNHGLRLPDANWNPDFVQTAQAALSYFPPQVQQRVDIVGAVTLELGQALLEITGPIELPDYQMVATVENLPSILGGHRDDFFPGSIQKKQAMSYVLTHVRLKISQFSPDQWLQLGRAGMRAIEQKSLQLYSKNATLQQAFEKNHLTGQLGRPDSELFYLVESNVGINKVNQYTTRAVRLHLSDYRLLAEVTFGHRPPTASDSSRLAYINYQRLFVPGNWQVKEITISGHPLEQWDERRLTANQQDLKEIGFLVPILPYENNMISVELTRSLSSAVDRNRPLYIQKQPGLPPTQYAVTRDSNLRTFTLDRDMQIPP